jgi:hypothetical protein
MIAMIFLALLLAQNTSPGAAQMSNSATISITRAVISPEGVLRCEWKIQNHGKQTLHVYASYLRGLSDGMIDKIDDHTILLRTTWLEQVDAYPAYYMAPPEFIDLEPGTEAAGSFERHIKSLSKHVSRVQLVVALGFDISRLTEDIHASLKQGREFQGNPIVRWQQLGYSLPAPLIQMPHSYANPRNP